MTRARTDASNEADAPSLTGNRRGMRRGMHRRWLNQRLNKRQSHGWFGVPKNLNSRRVNVLWAVLANMHPGITIQCDCGRTFRRSMHAVRTTGMAVCLSTSCGTIFDLTENATGAHIAIREEMFLCPGCRTSISLPSRVVRAGAKFDCSSCKASLQIHDGLWVTRSDTLSGGAP